MSPDLSQKLYQDFPDFFCPRRRFTEGTLGPRGWFSKWNKRGVLVALWGDIKAIYKNVRSWFQPRRPRSIMESCMAWGFECGDGWFDLIYQLCLDLKAMNPPKTFEVTQVKEKMGTLRFYTNSSTDAMEERIGRAETLSGEVCEDCGNLGSLRGTGWLFTACHEHSQGEPEHKW